LGRRRLNEKLGLSLPETEERVTLLDLIASVDCVLDFDSGNRSAQEDDRDSLANRRLLLPGSRFERIITGWLQLLAKKHSHLPIHLDARNGTAELDRDLVPQQMLTQLLSNLRRDNNFNLADDTNPLTEMMQERKVTHVGEDGLDAIKRVQALRLLHPSQFGRICPIETSDGMSAGITGSLASHASVTLEGEIMAPLQLVRKGRRQLQEPWRYMLAGEQRAYRTTQFDTAHKADGTLCEPIRRCDNKQDGITPVVPKRVNITSIGLFSSCLPDQVDYVNCAPPVSVAVGLIPFLEHDDATRAVMGAKMQGQAVPTLWPQRPIVGTGFDQHVARDSSFRVPSEVDGQVLLADGQAVTVVATHGMVKDKEASDPMPAVPEGWTKTHFTVRSELFHHPVVHSAVNKKRTLRQQFTAVAPGESVCVGDTVAEGFSLAGGDLAIGKNLVVAYVPWEGFNYEDSVLLSSRIAREDILTSIHVESLEMEMQDDEKLENYALPYMRSGLPQEGTWLEEGDIAAAKVKSKEDQKEMSPKLLRVPELAKGRVIHAEVSRDKVTKKLMVRVLLAIQCKIGPGDKLAGRHGNKGVVSRVQDERDMPYLPDGTPVDICLNPLGVPSRMNVGQIFELLLGTAGRWNGQDYRVGNFDEMFAEEASRGLVFEALRRARERSSIYSWLLDVAAPGKTRIYDGRSGRPFDQPVTVGVTYIIKLYHMVRDKVHGRHWGAYSTLTQQPLKGRSHGGGLRLGEMEVSCLVGYGAHATLQEMLTTKSDDITGRNEARKSMLQGLPVKSSREGGSEGFLTFKRELAATGIAVDCGAVGSES